MYHYLNPKNSKSKMAEIQKKLIEFDSLKAQAINFINSMPGRLEATWIIPQKKLILDHVESNLKIINKELWTIHPDRYKDLQSIEARFSKARGEYLAFARAGNEKLARLALKSAVTRMRNAYSSMEYDLDIGKPGGKIAPSTKDDVETYTEEVPCKTCGKPLPPSAIKKRSVRCITCYRKDKAKRDQAIVDKTKGWTATVTHKSGDTEKSFTVHSTEKKRTLELTLKALGDDVAEDDWSTVHRLGRGVAWHTHDKSYIITLKKGQ